MTTALGHRPVVDNATGRPDSGAAAGPLDRRAGRGTPPGRAGAGPGALGRIARLRHTSPGRLQLLIALLVTLGVLAGLVTGVAASTAAAGTGDLGNRAQPLLADAETIYSALAGADTTAAQAFLTGGLEPEPLTRRYEDSLARATTALTSAARRTPEGSEAAGAIRALATGTTRYAALVATARATNRQGLPVGASYLATASRLNRETLLPQAQTLYQIAQREVRDGYRGARAEWWLVLLLVLLVTLGFSLVGTQVYLSGATNRTFNVPLVAATALTVVLSFGTYLMISGQRGHLAEAEDAGSKPVAAVTEMRILALRERADEALTLAARGGAGELEADFQDARKRLTFTGHGQDEPWELMETAREHHAAYVRLHERVRELDDSGDYEGAVELAVSDETTRTFQALTDTLDEAIADRRARFDAEIEAAGRGIGALAVLGPLLALAISGLAAAGLWARLREYR